MNANAAYIILIAIMLVPIVWLAWVEPAGRYALICLAILGSVIWLLTSLAGPPKNTLLTGDRGRTSACLSFMVVVAVGGLSADIERKG
jgi:hypothetical protein